MIKMNKRRDKRDLMANVLIYGAGAVGSLMGYILSHVEGKEVDSRKAEGKNSIENVALLGRKSHVDKVREDGLKVNRPGGSRRLKFRYCFSKLDQLGGSGFHPDAVIICVKSPALERVKDEIASFMSQSSALRDAEFIILMNGMANRDILAPLIPSISEGITSVGIKFSGDGSIELKGMGKTIFEAGISEKLKSFIRSAFQEKGFEIEFVSAHNFKGQQWMKLIVNSAINPLTAILRKENEIVLSDNLQETVRRVVEECVKVASKEGLEIDSVGALDLVRSVASRTAMNTSSMLQDVLKGRKTEINSINGYVVALGKKHSVEVPVNETLYSLMKVMEQKVEI
jgi:2-dehydropantoate 2-reductase